MARGKKTRMVRAGGRTYFFDVKTSKDGKQFLVVTESRWNGENEKHQRSSITVFPQQAKDFAKSVTKMAAQLA
jgi:hypothetical protein